MLLFGQGDRGQRLIRNLTARVTDRWFRYISVPLLLRTFKKGDIVIDCGANVGVYTELFAATGATVYAFEPHPLAFAALKQKTANLPNVQLFNQAVSDTPGRTKLYFHAAGDSLHASQSASLMAEKDNISTEHFAEVDVIRFADFLSRFKTVRFVKMDIEGAEYRVLPDLIAHGLQKRVQALAVETHERNPGLQKMHDELLALIAREQVTNIDLSWH